MISPQQYNLLGFNLTGDLGPYTCYTSKRRKLVVFTKAPPKTPTTHRQQFQRQSWIIFARDWKLLPQTARDLWELATKRGSLFLTGYNLYIWYRTTMDTNSLRTIINQTHVPIPY